jgi:hypothetical protein
MPQNKEQEGLVMSAERPGSGTGKIGEPDDAPMEFTPAGKVGDDPLTRNLKKVYADIAAEPIPEHLLMLLDRLDSHSISEDESEGKK